MSYQTIEPEERIEDSLEFKSFLGNEGSSGAGASGQRRARSGYFQDATDTPGGFWTVQYYQKYFDVDTETVLKRCYTTLWPFSPSYLTTHTSPNPDFYGPFWTLTTLIFSLFVFSSFTASLIKYMSPESKLDAYDFTKLSWAVTVVYSYGLGFPTLVWIALRYMGVGMDEWPLIEALSCWGYGMFVWIPISLICVAPFSIVRYVGVGMGFGLSGYFIFGNVYPVIVTASHKSARALIPFLIIMHAAVSIIFYFVFYHYYLPDEFWKDKPATTGPTTTLTGTVAATTGTTTTTGTTQSATTTARMFF